MQGNIYPQKFKTEYSSKINGLFAFFLLKSGVLDPKLSDFFKLLTDLLVSFIKSFWGLKISWHCSFRYKAAVWPKHLVGMQFGSLSKIFCTIQQGSTQFAMSERLHCRRKDVRCGSGSVRMSTILSDPDSARTTASK